MIVGGLLREFEVLAPQPYVTRSGEEDVSWDAPGVVARVRGWIQPRSGDDDEPIKAASSLTGRAYLFPDAPVTTESRLRDDSGRVWRLSSPPAVKGTPFTADHIEVDVVSVEVAGGPLGT